MGFIAIDRDIENHWIYKDAEYFKVWFEILLRTRFSQEPEKILVGGQFINVEYGQFVYGRVSWSERLGISEQRLRTLFKRLQDDDMIEVVQRLPKLTIYSVKNYSKYNQQPNQQTNQQKDQERQGISDDANHQTNSISTANQPATNHQPTSNQPHNNKEIKKQRNKVIKNNYAEFVTLTDLEYEKLVAEHGEQAVKEMIEILNSYKAASGRKYKSDYHTMTGRGWVLEKYRKESLKVLNRQPSSQQHSQYQRTKSRLQQLYEEAMIGESSGGY